MKKLLVFLVALSISIAATAQQQKNCYLYSQKVFESMPEYKTAIETLDAYEKMARNKIETMMKDVKSMFEEYRQYRDNMTSAQEKRLKQQITDKEREANNYEKEVFGENGEFAKKQKELMEPIERKVMAVVEAVAKREGYDMVFDLSLVKVTIYQSARLDITEKVIESIKNYNYK